MIVILPLPIFILHTLWQGKGYFTLCQTHVKCSIVKENCFDNYFLEIVVFIVVKKHIHFKDRYDNDMVRIIKKAINVSGIYYWKCKKESYLFRDN